MKLNIDRKSLVAGILIGSLSTLVAGFILLHYEYSFLKSRTSHPSPRTSIFSTLERSIKVSPFSKWSQSVLFNKKRYYKIFKIKLSGGNQGFPPNTAIQISTTTGRILNIAGPEAIRPRLAGGDSAVNWIDKNYKESTKTVFVDGPNARLTASMDVTIISKGKDVPDNAIKLIVSPPGDVPASVDYKTDVNWSDEK